MARLLLLEGRTGRMTKHRQQGRARQQIAMIKVGGDQPSPPRWSTAACRCNGAAGAGVKYPASFKLARCMYANQAHAAVAGLPRRGPSRTRSAGRDRQVHWSARNGKHEKGGRTQAAFSRLC